MNHKLKKEKVLIAEVCDKTGTKLCNLLEAGGFEVIFSHNEFDAIEKTMQTSPDLIILGSMNSSGMNAYQVCRLLKNDPASKSVPIIILSHDKESNNKLYRTGDVPDETLFRGCEDQELLDAVTRNLGKKNGDIPSEPAICNVNPVTKIDVIAKLNKLLDKKFYETALFSDLTGLVQNIFSYDDLAMSIMDIFSELIDYSVAMVIVTSDEGSKLTIHIHNDVNAALFAKVKETGFTLFNEEIPTIANTKTWTKTISKDRIKNDLEVPGKELDTLLYKNISANGVLSKGFIIFGSADNKVDDNKRDLLNIFIHEAYTILENAWLYSKLYKNIKNLSITDGLTGIYNHKYILGLVRQEFSRAKRYNHDFSLIMFDIDHFKNINDTFGHQTGDVVLREISTIIKDAVRTSDVVGRYGGEEFAVVLTETDADEAQIFAERLRKRVEEFKFFNPADPLKITASMGLACYPLNGIDTPNAFIKCADEALYKAKAEGRNMVCVYQDTSE